MANGTYGIRKPANITYNDIDIFYHYRPTRGTEAPGYSEFKNDIKPEEVFSNCYASGMPVSGLYNLRLPLKHFGKKGIYTIYIVPKEIETTIVDVITLTGNYTNIRGIVLDSNSVGIGGNGELVGYRVEYYDGSAKTGDYRIITSNNKCEPVSQNTAGSAMQKSVRYRFNDSSNLIFCTVTPSTAPSFKSGSLPNIGSTGQMVHLVNTKFNPILLEVEMVTHDADTISIMLEGSQVRNLDEGIITTFDEDGNIYHQAVYGNITEPNSGLHEDFKIKYSGNLIIRKEEDKLNEIKEAINGQTI